MQLSKHHRLGKVENRTSQRGLDYKPSTLALAHEIRNPLTNINLAVEMLRSNPGIENQEMLLDIISRASCKIGDLINSLLSYPRNGQPGKHSIHQLLDEVLVSTRDRIVLKHVFIKKEYALQDCEIVINKPDMKMALTNIIVNAIEAMPGEKGILKVLTKSKEDKFIIHIEDNGRGISKKDLKNIFNPYFTNKTGGLGLGLAATSDILQSNHCAVHVESEVDKGTCFEISLDKNY